MRRTQILAASWLLAALLFAAALPSPVSAQDDLRGIVPYIMLVVDTSGSMERQAICKCETASCAECLPRCSMGNVGGIAPPEKMNRWAVTLEALTGTFNNFECDPIERTAANGMTYDEEYSFPYFQPWRCGGSTAGTPCAFDSPQALLSQERNGILDLNVSGIRFGLMTFDGVSAYGRVVQLKDEDFLDARSRSIEGLWSYGGRKMFRYPGCADEYFMDTGARSNVATEGALISLESCSGPVGTPACEAWCTACPGNQDTVNRDIQESLLATRPFGSTPIAAALDDLRYHFSEDLSDAFKSCRHRYGILITDGRPDDDYRFAGCDCVKEGNCPVKVPAYTEDDVECPYPLPETAAQTLVEGIGSEPAMLERLYVLGLAVSDDNVATDRLEKIADSGCTDTPEECEIGETNKQAILANDLKELQSAIQAIVQDASSAVSRTVPVFATTDRPAEPQFMFNTALRLPTQAAEPWRGVLERRRFVCGASDSDSDSFATLSASRNDFFHDELNEQSSRTLYTVLPSTVIPDVLKGTLDRESGPCSGANNCRMFDILTEHSPGQIQQAFELPDITQTMEVANWMYAKDATPRANAALGAIYHSTPAISSAPRYDTVDDDFTEWRRREAIQGRPQVLYVGTTDGVLHAFSAGDFSTSVTATNWGRRDAGQELWGFIPPMLLGRLKANLTTQQFLLDAPPVVKTVNVDGSKGADGYRTLLVMGMREGGNAYISLDVTDPFNPRFLWQFTKLELGKTYGQPAVVQARFKRPGYVHPTGGGDIKDGAIVILPGGVGQPAVGGLACNGGTTLAMRSRLTNRPFQTQVPPPPPPAGGTTSTMDWVTHRSDVRCWSEAGRSLYFLDAEDGLLIKEIRLRDPDTGLSTSNQPVFPSPLVSTPAPFPDEPGTPVSRVFITDADGVIWRIDMRETDPLPDDPLEGWTARPFHDVFFGRSWGDGELSYEAPLLSVDGQGRPVVIVGTGDTGNFMKQTVQNRIVSLTELETTDDEDLPEHFQASINWEIRVKTEVTTTTFTDNSAATVDGFKESELVTGAMGLFEGQLFAGTFIAVANTSNVCDVGRGRLFAMDYLKPDYNDPNLPPMAGATTFGPKRVNARDPDDTESLVNILKTDPIGNNVKISGISLVQVPTCTDTTASYQDPWEQAWSGISNAAPPEMQMKAHADDDRDKTKNTVDTRDGSQISTVEMKVRPPVRFTRVTSWAATVE